MKEVFNPIVIDGKIIDLNSLSQENAIELNTKLLKKQEDIRREIDVFLKFDEKRDKVIDLLNDLKQVQEQLSVLKYITFDSKTKENLALKITKKKEYVDEQAKKYGQSSELASDSLKQYEESLEKIRIEYENELKILLVALGEAEKKEVSDTIKVQKETGIQEYTVEELRARLESLKETRKAIENIDTYIDSCSDRCNSTIDSITDNHELVPINEKKNIIGKFFGNFMDKIGGKSKFKENVVKPLDEKNNAINRILPIIKQNIKEEVIKKILEISSNPKAKSDLIMNIESLMPMISKGAVTVLSIVTSTASMQTIAIAGLATATAIATKAVIDKMKKNKENKVQEESNIVIEEDNLGDEYR